MRTQNIDHKWEKGAQLRLWRTHWAIGSHDRFLRRGGQSEAGVCKDECAAVGGAEATGKGNLEQLSVSVLKLDHQLPTMPNVLSQTDPMLLFH